MFVLVFLRVLLSLDASALPLPHDFLWGVLVDDMDAESVENKLQLLIALVGGLPDWAAQSLTDPAVIDHLASIFLQPEAELYSEPAVAASLQRLLELCGQQIVVLDTHSDLFQR